MWGKTHRRKQHDTIEALYLRKYPVRGRYPGPSLRELLSTCGLSLHTPQFRRRRALFVARSLSVSFFRDHSKPPTVCSPNCSVFGQVGKGLSHAEKYLPYALDMGGHDKGKSSGDNSSSEMPAPAPPLLPHANRPENHSAVSQPQHAGHLPVGTYLSRWPRKSLSDRSHPLAPNEGPPCSMPAPTLRLKRGCHRQYDYQNPCHLQAPHASGAGAQTIGALGGNGSMDPQVSKPETRQPLLPSSVPTID